MKSIWQTKFQQWDSVIADELNEKFAEWVSELNAGEAFDVPCWYGTSDKSIKNQLHVFSDASEDAFCAVAPLRHHTVPKLELMAAVTANRLRNSTVTDHTLHFHETFMWSDSTTVIQWI